MKMTRLTLVAVFVFAGMGAFAQTQMELTESADDAYKKADAELNAVYKQVMVSLPAPAKEALKQSQVAWIRYRDLCIKSEGAQYEGGSIQPMIELKCGAELSQEKAERLRGMLPEAVNKLKTALPKAEAQQDALKKADARLNKVYKDFMGGETNKPVKDAQLAWLKYRDLCAKAEAALYDAAAAPVVEAKCVTELTLARKERLKGLFMERYDEEEDPAPAAK